MLEILMYKNGFMKKNIVRFFFIMVLANTFYGCTKEDYTVVRDIRIESATITNIGRTSAVFTVKLKGEAWDIYEDELVLSYIGKNAENISISWDPEPYDRLTYVLYLSNLLPETDYMLYAEIQKGNIVVKSDICYFTTKP